MQGFITTFPARSAINWDFSSHFWTNPSGWTTKIDTSNRSPKWLTMTQEVLTWIAQKMRHFSEAWWGSRWEAIGLVGFFGANPGKRPTDPLGSRPSRAWGCPSLPHSSCSLHEFQIKNMSETQQMFLTACTTQKLCCIKTYRTPHAEPQRLIDQRGAAGWSCATPGENQLPMCLLNCMSNEFWQFPPVVWYSMVV